MAIFEGFFREKGVDIIAGGGGGGGGARIFGAERTWPLPSGRVSVRTQRSLPRPIET